MGIIDSVGVFFESIVKSSNDTDKEVNKVKKTAQMNKKELEQVKEELKQIRKQKDKRDQYLKGKNP